ncbi:MAG: hypothetical protein ABSG96_10540 [Terracidiphilus sp.]
MLPEATPEFSALPAQRMRLIDRGVLNPGLWADGVAFDPATIGDKAAFAYPTNFLKAWSLCWSMACPKSGRARGPALFPARCCVGRIHAWGTCLKPGTFLCPETLRAYTKRA